MTDQLIINTAGLSPALINDLKKAIGQTFRDYSNEFTRDKSMYWEDVPDTSSAKIQMEAWSIFAHKEHCRFCREYPR